MNESEALLFEDNSAHIQKMRQSMKAAFDASRHRITQKVMQPLINNLVKVAKAMVASKSYADTSEALQALGMDSVASAVIARDIFGETGVVASLHARKIATALDFIDWEGMSNNEKKTDVQMKDIPARHVELSVQTWIPIGDEHEFNEMMHALGYCIGNGNKTGSSSSWSKMNNAIAKHFKAEERKLLEKMVEAIFQFYKCIVTPKEHDDEGVEGEPE